MRHRNATQVNATAVCGAVRCLACYKRVLVYAKSMQEEDKTRVSIAAGAQIARDRWMLTAK